MADKQPEGAPVPSTLPFGPDWKGIEADFTYHAPTEDQVDQLEGITIAARTLAEVILANCPPGPDRSAAYRCVREARMWANAAIVIPRTR